MFISNLEKENIHTGMLNLHSDLAKLKTDLLVLTAKIKVLEEKKPEVAKPARKKKAMTAAQKAKQRQYQKAYNERKKAQAMATKLLTEETNVST
jgi:hypothetical protein